MVKRGSLLVFLVLFFACVWGLPAKAQSLTMVNDFFSTAKWGAPLTNPTYKLGTTAYFHTYVAGLTARPDGKYAVSGDLLVIAPDGKVGRWAPSLVNQDNLDQSLFDNGLLPVVMNIEMTATDPEGRYTFVILINDKVSGKRGAVAGAYTVTK